MKLQLDTTNKIIRIEEPVKIEELLKTLAALLPEGQFKEYTLYMTVINNWRDPITIPYTSPFNQPQYPPYTSPALGNGTGGNPFITLPWITCNAGTTSLNQGVYNIELNNQN